MTKLKFRDDEQIILLILIVIFLWVCGIGITKRENLKEVKIDKRININTADAFTLEALPYVGSKRAAKIIESRQKYGPFSSLEDVRQRIKGIGIKRLEKWKDLVTFGSNKVLEKGEGSRKE